ncbi:hypothetical protein F9K85_21935 [Brucella tritici]|uniref:hypothetical protein n=1 Tax=Brucella tritici TaxID=94626 RepID=UPI00124F16B3|nr:hypothetical protein [Brucella tritici]KAB2671372.1 hypothetical protein F9K85_21935 [Brucella tritici]
MNKKKNPWSDPTLDRNSHAIDPNPVEPKDHNEKPTHEQANAPGNPKKKLPKEPYPDRSTQ